MGAVAAAFVRLRCLDKAGNVRYERASIGHVDHLLAPADSHSGEQLLSGVGDHRIFQTVPIWVDRSAKWSVLRLVVPFGIDVLPAADHYSLRTLQSSNESGYAVEFFDLGCGSRMCSHSPIWPLLSLEMRMKGASFFFSVGSEAGETGAVRKGKKLHKGFAFQLLRCGGEFFFHQSVLLRCWCLHHSNVEMEILWDQALFL